MSTKKRTTYPQLFGYGVGAIGLDLSYGLFFSILSFYLTDTLFFNASFLLVLLVSARIFDAFNDPFMGALVDKTKSRFGKYRPWMMGGAIANAIVLVFLFSNPWGTVTPGVRNMALVVYIIVLYFLWDITDTLMDIPYWSIVPSLESDPKRRNIAASVPRAFSGLGQVIIVVATPLMVPFLGGQDDMRQNPVGFQRWVFICALALIAFVFISFVATGKIKSVAQTTPAKDKITLRGVYNTLRQNDQLLVFMLVALLANAGWYLVTSLQPFFFSHVMEDTRLMALFGALVGGGMAVGLGILPVLTRWLARNTVIKVSMVMAIVGYVGMYIFGSVVYVFPLFIAFGLIGAMGVSCCFVSQTVMLSDVVDYGEYKLGKRNESTVFSMRCFLQKGAYTLQTIIMFSGLHFTGYRGYLDVQPAVAIQGISVMMFLVPPALVAIALTIFSRKYKLNEAKMEEVQSAIASKKSAPGIGSAPLISES